MSLVDLAHQNNGAVLNFSVKDT